MVSTGEARVGQQLRLLAGATAEARDRDVGYLETGAMPQAAMFREMAGLAEDVFAVVLVHDGAGIQRWDAVVPT